MNTLQTITKQYTLSELVGKYNQKCLDSIAMMYKDRQYELNNEYKCHRHILKSSASLEIEDFESFCDNHGFPQSVNLLNEQALYPFSVKNHLDYYFVTKLLPEQLYQFPELNNLLSIISIDNVGSILSLLKMYFQKKCESLCDIQADFFRETCSMIPDKFKEYDSWNDFIEDDDIVSQVKLEFIRLLVQHHPSVLLYFRLVDDTDEVEEVMYDIIGVDVSPIYEKHIVLSNGGRQLFEHLMGHHFNLAEKTSYKLFCGWFIYDKSDINPEESIQIENDTYPDDYVTKNRIDTLEWTDTFLYDEKEIIWSQMISGPVFPRFLMFMNTFRCFLYEQIKPEDRERFCFAGSMVKSLYKIRDVQDIDFLVSDTNGKIEGYHRFKPKLGDNIKGIMDDFGRTFYSVEEFYFPMIPELYKNQTKVKEIQREEDKNDHPDSMITNVVPKYSVSGLKAGRYIDIYSNQVNMFLMKMNQEDRELKPDVSTLDDIVFYPGHHFNFGGIKFIPLEYEILRDHMKDIDLKRVSRKQMMDFCEINREYSSQQVDPDLWSKMLGIFNFRFENASFITNTPCLSLEWNLYHGDIIQGKKTGYEVLIRHAPLKILNSTRTMLMDGLLDSISKSELPNSEFSLFLKKQKVSELTAIVHTSHDHEKNQRFMRNVLVTSIPSNIDRITNYGSTERYPSVWNYVITKKGELNICLITNPYGLGSWMPAFVGTKDEIVSGGQIHVVNIESGKEIHFNLILPNVITPILKKYDKKYESALYQFTKSVFQLHRFFDVLAPKKVTIHYHTESFTNNAGDCRFSGFNGQIFKTTNIEVMKQWKEQSKKKITDPLPLLEYLRATSS